MATILIVDDHVLNRQFLLALLGFEGHRLLEAVDGAQGLRLAGAEVPDLIITDIMMPNLDGYQFIKALRADPRLAAIPVIFYTATYSLAQADLLAQACAVHWVLHKPATPDAIMAVVRQALAPPPTRLAHFLHELDASSSEIAHIAGAPEAEDNAVTRVAQRLSQSLADFQAVGLRLTALIGMVTELASVRDPQQLLEAGCKIARRAGLARFAVLGVAPSGAAVYTRFATHGLHLEVHARLQAMGPPSTIFGAGNAARRLHAQGQAHAGLAPGHPALDSMLVVPLASPTRHYGWLYLGDKLGADRFSDIDEDVLVALAAQIGIAYENVILLERLQLALAQSEAVNLECQQMAARLQQSETQLRQLAGHQERVREDERKRIARDIHDELGQNLLALRIDVSMMAARPASAAASRERVGAALRQIDTSIKSVRAIINHLRPAVLDIGLHAAVEWQARQFERRNGITCRLQIDHDEFALDEQGATALFRILQEALSNIVRHAQARQVQILMQRRDGRLFMQIADDGVGLLPGSRKKANAFGLAGIEERILDLGGTFLVTSNPGQGTTLLLSILIVDEGRRKANSSPPLKN